MEDTFAMKVQASVQPVWQPWKAESPMRLTLKRQKGKQLMIGFIE